MRYYSKNFLISGFKRWLELMNYAASSVYYDPRRISVFLDWMERKGVTSVEGITGEKIKAFFEDLRQQKNQRTGAALGLGTMRSYLTVINRFGRYIRQAGIGHLNVPITFKGNDAKAITVLTKKEITQMYDAVGDDLLSMRDRAMLGIYYGCGVRRKEGANLKMGDLFFDSNVLYIRKGKGNKERYVPMVGRVRKDLLQYIQIARPVLLGKSVHEYLFVAITGKALGSEALYGRFKKLLKKAGIKKTAGLHTLRHSIATHLLSSGMKLSDIAKFLGHRSLESTQIYTHIEDEEIPF